MDLSRNAWFVRNLSGLYLFVLRAHVSLRMLIHFLICHIEAWMSSPIVFHLFVLLPGWVLGLHVCLCAACMPGALGGLNGMLSLLGLELQIV